MQRMKSASEIPLERIVKAEFHSVDNTLKSCELTLEGGKILRFEQESYSSFTPSITAPPKMVDAYKVEYDMLGKHHEIICPHSSAAATLVHQLEREYSIIGTTTTIQVPEEALAATVDQEIPF